MTREYQVGILRGFFHKDRFNIQSLPLCVFLEKFVELFEAVDGDLTEQGGELVLPLLAVRQDGRLQGRAVKQHKLDVDDCLLCLYVVGHFGVSAKFRINFFN